MGGGGETYQIQVTRKTVNNLINFVIRLSHIFNICSIFRQTIPQVFLQKTETKPNHKVYRGFSVCFSLWS